MRNQIYEAAVDAWLAAHSQENSRRLGMNPSNTWAANTSALFLNAPERLVLTPRSVGATPIVYAPFDTPGRRAVIDARYLAMKRDLIHPTLSHICRRITGEFRSIQRG
jgi:hypothetical protein